MAERDQIQPGRRVPSAAPGLLQRILLTTDGNVGRILQSYSGEAIVAAGVACDDEGSALRPGAAGSPPV